MQTNRQTDRQVEAIRKRSILDRIDFYIFHTPLLRISTRFLALK